MQRLEVKQPALWHPYHPSLYVLHTVVSSDHGPADDVRTRLGIRTIRFDKDQGLFINGEHFISIGANRHQDHPYVGYALSPEAQFRDARKLRDAGMTSFRSHYPQDPAFMDACDELGILAIISNPGWQFMGDDLFKERVLQDAREMVRSYRNCASAILWEAQLNETDNRPVAIQLQNIVHEEYPGDQCYAAGDRVRNLQGFNGWDVDYSGNNGSKPLWVREWGDQVDNWTDQQSRVACPGGRVRHPCSSRPGHTSAGWMASTHRPMARTGPGTGRLCGACLWAWRGLLSRLHGTTNRPWRVPGPLPACPNSTTTCSKASARRMSLFPGSSTARWCSLPTTPPISLQPRSRCSAIAKKCG